MANSGPGDEHPLQSVLSHDSESLLKLLSEEIECKSKRIVLKFGLAHIGGTPTRNCWNSYIHI